MTIIKTICPQCHLELVLEPADVAIRIGPGPDAGYRFICEGCLCRSELPLPPRGVDILTAAGAVILQITDDDAEPVGALPARLTHAEAMRFAYDLAQTDTPQDELEDL
jgi:hypothetical protein